MKFIFEVINNINQFNFVVNIKKYISVAKKDYNFAGGLFEEIFSFIFFFFNRIFFFFFWKIIIIAANFLLWSYRTIFFFYKGNLKSDQNMPKYKSFLFGENFMNHDAFGFSLTGNFFNIRRVFKPLIDFEILNARYNLFKKLDSVEQSRRVERFLEFLAYEKLSFIVLSVFELTNFFFLICLKNMEYVYNLINLISDFWGISIIIKKKKNSFFVIYNFFIDLLVSFLFFKIKIRFVYLVIDKLKSLVNVFYKRKKILYLLVFSFFKKFICFFKKQINSLKLYFLSFFFFLLTKISYILIFLFYFIFLQIPRIIFYCILSLVNFFFFFRLRKRTWLSYKLEYKKNTYGSKNPKEDKMNFYEAEFNEHYEFLENLSFFDKIIFKIRTSFRKIWFITEKIRSVENVPFFLYSQKEKSMQLFRRKKKQFNFSRIKKFNRRFKQSIIERTSKNQRFFMQFKKNLNFIKAKYSNNWLALILEKIINLDLIETVLGFLLILKSILSLLYVFFFFLISFYLSYFILKEVFIFFFFFISLFFLKKELIYFFIKKVSKYRLLNFQAFPKSLLLELCFNKSDLFQDELVFIKFLRIDLTKIYQKNQIINFFYKSMIVDKILCMWVFVFKASDVFFRGFLMETYIYILSFSRLIYINLIKNWYNVLLYFFYFYFRFIFINFFLKVRIIFNIICYNIFLCLKLYLILIEFLFNLVLIFFFIICNFFNIVFDIFVYIYMFFFKEVKSFILIRDFLKGFFKFLTLFFCLLSIFFFFFFYNIFKLFRSVLLTKFLTNRKIGLVNVFSLLYTISFNKNIFKYFSLKKRYKKSLYYRFQRSRKQLPYFRFHANVMKKISIDSRLYYGEGLYRGGNNERGVTKFKGNFGRNRFSDFFWLRDRNKIKMKFNLRKSLPVFGLFFFKNSNKVNDIFFKEFIFKRFTMRIVQGTLRGLRFNYVKNWLRNYQINLDIVNQNKLKVFPFFIRNNHIRLETLKLVLYKYRFISERFFSLKVLNFIKGSLSLFLFFCLFRIEISFLVKFILFLFLFCCFIFIYFYNLFLNKIYSRILNLYLFKPYEFTFKNVITNIFFFKNKRFLLSFKGFCFIKKLDFILKKETCPFSQFYDVFKFIFYFYVFIYFFKLIFFRLFYLIFFIDKKFQILNNSITLSDLFDLNFNYIFFFVNNFLYNMNLFSGIIVLVCGIISFFICVLVYYLVFKMLFIFCIVNDKFSFFLDYIIIRPGLNFEFNLFKLNFKFSFNLFSKIKKSETDFLEKMICLNMKKNSFNPRINIVNLEKELLLLKNINSLKSTKIIKTNDKNRS